MAIVGASGRGKTTLLKMLMGFDQPDSGDILFRGRSILVDDPYMRSISIALPTGLQSECTVWQNVMFPIQARVSDKTRWDALFDDVVRTARVPERILFQRVQTLSGGERQRVAIARALTKESDVLLLDEPTASLDLPLRKRLLREIKKLHDERGCTTVLVTHYPQEVMGIADRIVHYRKCEKKVA